MKVQEGEWYRLRNGEIVGPLIARDYASAYKFEDHRKSNAYSWDEDGRWQVFSDINARDIVEHIPKEKEMKEQMIKGTASVYAAGTRGYYDIHVTLAEAERLGEEAKRIKTFNEIKAGDWVTAKDGCIIRINRVDKNMCWFNRDMREVWLNKEALTKITNPAHIQTLNEICAGIK